MGLAVVTGATGHVGVNLCRALLAEGREVRAVGRRPLPAEAEAAGVEWAEADVRDAAAVHRALAGAEVVFHLAARISIAGDPDGSVWATNVEGTRNVVEAALAHGVRRLVHAGSIQAFDCERHVRDNPRTRVGPKRKLRYSDPVALDETTAPAERPTLPAYARSKAAGVAEVHAAIARGLDAVIVHPTAVVGPLDLEPSRMGAVLLAVAARRPLALVEGGFDWVDARDVAEGLLAAERAGRTGESYLLGGEWASLRRIARLVAHANGVQPPSLVAGIGLAEKSRPLVSRLWRGAEAAGFTAEALHAIRFSPHVSHAKAAGQLGYQPRPLEETARDLVEWLTASSLVRRRGEAIQGSDSGRRSGRRSGPGSGSGRGRQAIR